MKQIDWAELGPLFADGMTVMFGGFMGSARPQESFRPCAHSSTV